MLNNANLWVMIVFCLFSILIEGFHYSFNLIKISARKIY